MNVPPPYRDPDPQAAGAAPPPYQGPEAPPPYQPPDAGDRTLHSARDDRFPLAAWWRRATARIIDVGMLFIPALIVSALCGAIWVGLQLVFGSYSSSGLQRNFSLISTVCFFLLLTAYDSVCVAKWRTTFGKHLMGLWVAPLSGAGRQGPIPLMSTVARAALVHLPTLVYGIGVSAVLLAVLSGIVLFGLMPLWNRPNRQGLHDKVARTVVLRGG